jgi:hypothetical protein
LTQQAEGDAGCVVGALRPDLAFDVAGELLPKEHVLGRDARESGTLIAAAAAGQ